MALMRGIVWFRRDLRLADQPAFTAACKECGEVIPFFVFDQPLLQSHTFGSACVNFMLGCLHELAASLAGLGLPLHWRRGEPVEEVVRAARDWKADVVYWNRDYEPSALERDRIVQQQLAHLGVVVRTFKDHVVFEAEEIRGATGEPLQRYSAYRARWWTKWYATKPSALPVPKMASGATAPPSFPVPHPLPAAGELGYEPVTPWIEPGERTAQMRLRRFIEGPIHTYANGRNVPALDGSSKLSPHFRFGTLSPRLAILTAMAALGQRGAVSRADVLTWIDELVWREFFQQVLSAFPRVADGPFRDAAVPPSRMPGAERDRLFHAWCEGRTGYPIVDAGMRQLNRTSWMHNRVRMIVASFLIKDLRIDWQSGERYFMRHLLDADLAANNGNWQWCASTGTDAMRGYRIFNPVLQSRKFDPEGIYITAYVPELAKVARKWIHEPHLMTSDEQVRCGCRIGVDYPAAIVDHAQARREYLELGKQQVTR
jgi:deoxyribodipyrimidine photo-lyase